MADEIVTLLPGENEEDGALLDRVVQGIREIHLRKGLEYYLELGKYLIDEMFGGDYAAFERRRGTHKSFRALAKREDLPLSHVMLNAAVRVRHQYDQLSEKVRDELTMGHHRALLPVDNDKDRNKLAREALKGKWTVEALKERVRQRVEGERDPDERRGRRPLPRFEKTLNLLGRVLKTDEAFADLDKIENMDPDRAKELHGTVLDLKSKCQELQEALQGRIPGFN